MEQPNMTEQFLYPKDSLIRFPENFGSEPHCQWNVSAWLV